jgi:hypothetical protein
MSTQDNTTNDGGRTCFHGAAWKSTKVFNEACFRCREMEGAYDTQTRQLGGRATKRARENGQKYTPRRVWARDPESGVTWPEAVGTDRRFAGSRIQRKGGGGPSIRKVHDQSPRRATWGVQRSIVKAQRKEWAREWEVVRFLREEAPEGLRDKRTFTDVEWASLMVRWPGGPYEHHSEQECADTLSVDKSTFQENYQRAYAKAVRVRDYVQKALLYQENGVSTDPYIQELLKEFQPDESTELKRERERERKARKRGARRRPSVCGVAMRGKAVCSRPPAHQGQHRSSR